MTALQKVEQKIRDARAEISTDRPDWPSTHADWMYFTARLRVLNTLVEERKLLLLVAGGEGH